MNFLSFEIISNNLYKRTINYSDYIRFGNVELYRKILDS